MSLQLFTNPEFELPVEFDQDSFFAYAAPIAQQLGYRDASDLRRSLPGDCMIKRRPSEIAGQPVPAIMLLGDQADWYLNEAGFYRALGQRQTAKIRDADTRARVERFQRWVFHDVLPSIRKRGGYEVAQFTTWNRDEVCAQIRQAYGFDFNPATLGRSLIDAGVIKQNGAPKVKYKHLFHHTGSAWNLHPLAMRQIVVAVLDARQAIEAAKAQMSLLEAES